MQDLLSDSYKTKVHIHVHHLKHYELNAHQMLVETEIPEVAPNSSSPIQTFTLYEPVRTAQVRMKA